jgi:hypothetical protein
MSWKELTLAEKMNYWFVFGVWVIEKKTHAFFEQLKKL